MKMKIQHKQNLLSAKAVTTALLITCFLPVTGHALTQHTVNLPNSEYIEKSDDMSVKVLNSIIKLNRTWKHGRWQLNPGWSNLRLVNDFLDDSIKYIDRDGEIYQRNGQSNIYTFRYELIRQTATGWQWYDKLGNWIDYDKQGRLTAYGNRNGIQAQFILDDEGRRLAIHDANNQLVYQFEYDENDFLTKVTDRTGRHVNYSWSNERLTKVTDVLGYEWTYQYDNNGQLIQRTEPDGGKINITYAYSTKAPTSTMKGKPITLINATGVVSTTEKKTDYNIARVGKLTDKTGNSTIWNVDYSKTKHLFTVTEDTPSGAIITSQYNINSQLINYKINDVVKLKVETDGKYLKKLINERGSITTIQYDNNLRPIKVTHPNGSYSSIKYDPNMNNPVEFINPLGVRFQWQYDNKGNVIKYIAAADRPEQRITTVSYNDLGQMVAINKQDSQNKTITYQATYDEFGNIATMTDGEGNIHYFQTNVQGLVTKYTDPLGKVWLYDYNDAGQLIKMTDPLNSSTTLSTDAFGRLIKQVDPLGRIKTFQYQFDKTGYQIDAYDPLKQKTVYNYDSLFNLIQKQSPTLLLNKFIYNEEGKLKEIIDQTDQSIVVQYGNKNSRTAGLITKIEFPTYYETYQYNSLDKISEIKNVIDDNNALTNRFDYDSNGNVISQTLPGEKTMHYEYDAFGHIIKQTDVMGNITQIKWNQQDKVTEFIDANKNKYLFEYDNNGQLIKKIDATNAQTNYQYNAAGLLIQETDAAGNTIHYQYDAARNLITVIFTAVGESQPEQTLNYRYNAAGEPIEIIQSGKTNSQIIYTLDELGRKIEEKITYGKGATAFTKTLAYRYDGDNNLIEMTYPDQTKFSYQYEKGQLKSSLLANQKTIQWQKYQWQLPIEIQSPGAKETVNADGLLRPLAIEINNRNNKLFTQNFQYDNANNISHYKTQEGEVTYHYDQLTRLTQAIPSASLQQKGLPIESYNYDAAGNRIGSVQQPGQWHYAAGNQLLQWGEGNSKTIQEYSPTGNIIKQITANDVKNYTYDSVNRLVSVEKNNQNIATYQYDAIGRRMSKTVDNVTTYYLYSDEGLIAELNEQGQIEVAYGFTPNTDWGTKPLWQAIVKPNQTLTNAQYHYLYLDHLGTPKVAVNDQGEISWQALTDAFGNTIVNDNSKITVNLRFPGQYYDVETGTHYNYYRNYQPATGRYMQQDPIGLVGGLNLYNYANSNPIAFFDNYGLLLQHSTIFGFDLFDLFGGGAEIGFTIIIPPLFHLECFQIGMSISAKVGAGFSTGVYAGATLSDANSPLKSECGVKGYLEANVGPLSESIETPLTNFDPTISVSLGNVGTVNKKPKNKNTTLNYSIGNRTGVSTGVKLTCSTVSSEPFDHCKCL